MYQQTIENKTKRVLEKIAKSEIAKNFYLVGGTGLALQLGHRQSIDLDWFSSEKFSNNNIKKIILKICSFELINETVGTIHGKLDNVKVSFLHYGYKSLYPFIDFAGLKIADERDIAAMKIDAASARGSKKDFIDLYFLMEKYSLPELIAFFEKKYKNIKYNKLHILKSLVFYEDAEAEPMPLMLKKISWSDIKKKLTIEVNKILKA